MDLRWMKEEALAARSPNAPRETAEDELKP
jgi:hypothetical protein